MTQQNISFVFIFDANLICIWNCWNALHKNDSPKTVPINISNSNDNITLSNVYQISLVIIGKKYCPFNDRTAAGKQIVLLNVTNHIISDSTNVLCQSISTISLQIARILIVVRLFWWIECEINKIHKPFDNIIIWYFHSQCHAFQKKIWNSLHCW